MDESEVEEPIGDELNGGEEFNGSRIESEDRDIDGSIKDDGLKVTSA